MAETVLCLQAFGDRQWFRPASERQRYQLQAKQHSLRLIKRPFRDCPFHLLLLNDCGFCRFPDSPAAPRLWDSRGKMPSAFTDEVNCINEKQKAVLEDR